MIGHGKAISHGINLLNYIAGESVNKKHPEKIYRVEDRFLPEGLDARGIWDKMQQRSKVKNNVIRLEFSPAKEYTEHFTLDDWRKLSHDIMQEYDKIELKSKETGEVYSPKTNIFGSQSTCWLHHDSAGGIPHLHIAVCKHDELGNPNNDRNIHLRAQQAAEAVALKRGWKTARQKHIVNVNKVNADIVAVLKAMTKWDWADYVARLNAKGYQVHINVDKQGVVHGYSIKMGNSGYKASDLGQGRNLTLSHIQNTWSKLHPAVVKEQSLFEIAPKDNQPAQASDTPNLNQPLMPDARRIAQYTQWVPEATGHEIKINGNPYKIYLPKEIETTLNEEVDQCQICNWDDVQSFAITLFLCTVIVNNVNVGGSGGGDNHRGWRDDDRERMRNCCRISIIKYAVRKKSGYSY